MELNARRIAALAEGVSAEQARWKPGPESWSILEVLGHLYDEEHLDFRVRLDLLLHQPGTDWPPIDPPGWVIAHAYNQQDAAETLRGFLSEREASLAWLRGLIDPDLQRGETAPWGGLMRAGDMLASWAAHDLLHLRQLVELQRAYVGALSEPYRTEYAGEW